MQKVFKAPELPPWSILEKDMIDEIADGEVISLVVEEMDEKEFDSLPEFTGW